MVLAAASAVALVGCDPCDADDSSADCVAERMADKGMTVTVELQSAVIAPGKLSREPWDADGTQIPTQTWSQLATALAGANPYVSVSALLINPVLAGTKAPDPYGTARLDVGQSIGTTLALGDRATNMEDTYTPTFSRPALWVKVPIDQNVRIKVDLNDEDLINDDAIGVAEVNSAQLKEALAAGKVYHVPVADQTNQQILFLGLSVRQ
jgi:hypothetical protein